MTFARDEKAGLSLGVGEATQCKPLSQSRMLPFALGRLPKLQRKTGRLHIHLVVSQSCVVTTIIVVVVIILILSSFWCLEKKWLKELSFFKSHNE